MDLESKKIILTGGVKGIGYAILLELLKKKCTIGVFDIDQEGLSELKANHPKIITFLCDVTNSNEVEAKVNQFFTEFGKIDILINNAGFLYNSPLVHFSSEGIKKHNIQEWSKTLAANLDSVFYMSVNVAEKMLQKRTKGLILNISSVSACGNRGQSAYSAAKAGVNALTATWAKELGIMGIRVVGVAPGYTNTDSTNQILSKDIINEIKKDIPLRRLGRAEEIAQGVISIINNDYINGKIIEIDGGLIL